MPLSVGDKLGPYEILAPIGAGGMGEVWKAHDPRLRRDVAIKVSVQQFSERFEREAHAIAALNHTNICQVYDVGPNYLVMEFIEGESPKGPMPLDEALRIARQIADALEAAHDKGITHRDLKPGNIKIKPDGTVKVLDFGLAKIHAGPASSGQNSPTLTIGMTQAGMILGTAAYMAPEQARGKETVDKRADIWAFGVVLYEMLTGKRLFQGEDVGEILASVIKEQPNLDEVPRQVRPLLKRCLEKDPKNRLRDIGDAFALVLDEAEPATPAELALAPRHRSWLPWCIAGFFLLALMPGNILHFREPIPPSPEPARFYIPVPDKGAFAGFPNPIISPDGRRVVFSVVTDGVTRLWVRMLDQIDPRPLAGTEGVGGLPFWSPDSRFIAFAVQDTLKKIEASGGPAESLCTLPAILLGGFWTNDGRIVFGTLTTGLFQVPAAGGSASQVTVLDPKRQEVNHSFPIMLPDGRNFLYFRNTTSTDTRGIYLGTFDTGIVSPDSEKQAPKRLLADGSSVVFAKSADQRATADGYVLFSREGTLMGRPFDSRRLEFSGDAVPIAEQVGGNGDFSVSSTGILVYATRVGAAGGRRLTWYDRKGRSLGNAGVAGVISELELAPDGMRVAAVRSSPSLPAIWIDEFARAVSNRIKPPDNSTRPVWSPDGNQIVFESGRNVYLKAASNAGNEMVLFKSERSTDPLDWSRDGRWLLYQETDPNTKHDLKVVPLESGKPVGKPIVFLQTGSDEREGKFSTDTRFIAYTSDESGRSEVYVASFPTPSLRVPISNGGGYQPRWRRDGKELLYFTGDAKLMSVDVTLGGTFKADIPKVLFQVPIFGGGASQQHRWDMTPDGQRFLINTIGGDVSAPLTLVENWMALLHK